MRRPPQKRATGACDVKKVRSRFDKENFPTVHRHAIILPEGRMQKVSRPFPFTVGDIISRAFETSKSDSNQSSRSIDDAIRLRSDVQVAIQHYLEAMFLQATVSVHRTLHSMSGTSGTSGTAEEQPSSSWVQAPLTSLSWGDGPGRFVVRLYDDGGGDDRGDDQRVDGNDGILVMVGNQYHTLREGAMAVFTLFDATSVWLKSSHRIVVGSFEAPPYLPKTPGAPPFAIINALPQATQKKSWAHAQDITAAYRRVRNLSPVGLVAPDASSSPVYSMHLRTLEDLYTRQRLRAMAKAPVKMTVDFFTESQCRACIAYFKTHFKIIPDSRALDFDKTHEYQLDTDMPTLIDLVGDATVERLRAAAPDGARWTSFLRRYTPTTRAAIPMHTDNARFTINVELGGAYQGGRLITLGETSDGSRLQFHAHQRPRGSMTSHGDTLVHGVEPVADGERFTYIFFFH